MEAGKLVGPSGESPLGFLEADGILFVAVPDLASPLKATLVTDEPGAIWTWKLEERTVHFTIEAPVATVDDAVTAMPAPPRVVGSVPLVPLEFALRQLLEPAGWTGEWNRGERILRLRPSGGAASPVQVSVAHSSGVTRCVFTFDSPVRYTVEKKGDQATLQFALPRLDAPFPQKEFQDPIAASVSFRGKSATVHFRRGSWASEVYSLSAPFRVVVEVQAVAREIGGIRIGKAPAASTAAEPPHSAVRTIVIDPGHGGTEVGAQGKLGNLEKDLTLELARALKPVLEANGHKVLLTRDKDVQLPLEDRPAFANHNNADLFVSIHLNASPGKRPRGSETYYLSLSATDESARKLADSENAAEPSAVTRPAGSSEDLDFLLWDLVQNEHVKESALLAESIQMELDALVGLSNRGIKQAPFRVLVGAAMPAVLIEVAFISNPEEEKSLLQPEFRKKVAEAIAAGIEAYRAKVEPRLSQLPATAPAPPAGKTP